MIEVLLATALVVTWKVAVVAFAATVTLLGTLPMELSLLANVITTPPEGACALRVTVPVDGFPPTTEPGLSVTEESVTAAGVTFRFAF